MNRLRLTGGRTEHIEADRAAFADDVRAGLAHAPRRLPCRWLYDPEGSRLFEEICRLPEYYIPAAESEILAAHAGDIVIPGALVELGSGSATKTRYLIEAALRQTPRLRYVPIDVSRAALAESSAALLADYPGLFIDAVCAEYEDGLSHLPRGPKLVLWLGSNIGNLDRDQAAGFLRRAAVRLEPEDRVVVGIDLRKRREVVQAAYDDPQGITARFNLNLLRRINRELGGDFDVDAFRHRAVYDADAGRVSMYLVSERAQRVRIPAAGLDVAFGAREQIHTEDSYKYSPEEIEALARAAGLRIERVFVDAGRRFCDVLFTTAGRRAA